MVRQVTLDELDLSAYIRPGDGIVMGQGTAEPLGLTAKLVEQRSAFSGAQVFLPTAFSDTFQPQHADHLRFRGTGGIGSMRKLASSGALDPIPCHISSVGQYITDGLIASDVIMLLVSPPNERGEYSLGLVNDYVRAAIERARVVIAEVSEHVPWVYCDQPLLEKEITLAVHTDTQPGELPMAAFTDKERQIAAHLQPFIPDRSTLQVGIGAVPEAILASLSDRRDLGLHSGMLGDSVVDFIEKGIITNAYKGIDTGVSVTGALFGTREKLYKHAHQNPALRLCSTRYTHDFRTFMSVNNLVSLNSALEVDLTGQVNAEAIGSNYFGAVGGQVDFVRAAAMSGGVSIIALPAMGKNNHSRIVSALSGPVTTARSDVDVIATEYGVARLKGLGLRERIRAMVAIAAPEHREALLEEARKTWRDL